MAQSVIRVLAALGALALVAHAATPAPCPGGGMTSDASAECCQTTLNTGTWFRDQACCSAQGGGCFCNPSVTPLVGDNCALITTTPPPTTVPTTTPTGTTPTTTELATTPEVICPAQGVLARLLKESSPLSTLAPTCQNGLVALYTTGFNMFCNAAVVYLGGNNHLRQLWMSDGCYQKYNTMRTNGDSVKLLYQGNEIDLDDCGVESAASSEGTWRVTFSQPLNWYTGELTKACTSSVADRGAACVATDTAMRNKLSFTNCYVSSYGTESADTTTDAIGTTPIAYMGSVNWEMFPSGCTTTNTIGASRMCFKSTVANPCKVGDDGAPLYCKTAAGESVLRGFVNMIDTCSAGTGTFHVDLV